MSSDQTLDARYAHQHRRQARKSQPKSQDLTTGENVTKQKRAAKNDPLVEPMSNNSSQEFGIQSLSLASVEAKKIRKGGEPPIEDPGGPGTGFKRPKTLDTAQPNQSSRLSSIRSHRASGRSRRDAGQRSSRVVPAPRQPDISQRSPTKPGPQQSDALSTVNSATHLSAQADALPAQGQQLSQSSSHVDASAQNPVAAQAHERCVINMPIDPRYPDMYWEPDARPISEEQLAVEIRSIYGGLAMVEAKCIHVDKAQAAALRNPERGESALADEHWRALTALHRTLLHEHHDFLLASQHPSASKALKSLPAKYSMPARMWKHGIYSYLELLRYRLPDSLEYMISYIYFAYQMMSLLYETVEVFRDTWIECLGDLGRYRMAVEEDDFRDRETWAGVARFWYTKAADRSPEVGRLSHHLAILARPNALQQLHLYCRALISVQPFLSARESITTLFDPIMGSTDASALPISRLVTVYIRCHGILCLRTRLEDFPACLNSFLERFASYVEKAGRKLREEGAYFATSAIAALFEYGSPGSMLRKVMDQGNSRLLDQNTLPPSKEKSEPGSNTASNPDSLSRIAFSHAISLFARTTQAVLRRTGDINKPMNVYVLPFINVVLTFLHNLLQVRSFNLPYSEEYLDPILKSVPWGDLCVFANSLGGTAQVDAQYEKPGFPQPEKGDIGVVPEDYAVRGTIMTQNFYPKDWFTSHGLDEEERSIEHASTMIIRIKRFRWLMCRLAERNQWVNYDQSTKTWSTPFVQRTTNEVVEPLAADTHSQEDMQMDDYCDPDTEIDVVANSPRGFDDDTRTMLELREASRQLQKSSRLTVPSEVGPAQAAEEIMQSGFTVLVVDSDLILNQQDVFKLLTDRGLRIVIPNSVIVTLLQLSKNNNASADGAIRSIKAAIEKRKTILILAEDGTDITGSAFTNWEAANEEPSSKGDKDMVLIKATRRATDLSSREESNLGDKPVKPAFLVTESQATRIRAKYEGVAAIATSMLRSVLLASTRKRSSSRSSIGRHSPLGSDIDVMI